MNKLASAVVLAAVSIVSTSPQSANAAKLQTITIADVGSGSAIHWPIYGAMAKGYFQDSGIVVNFIPTQSAPAAILQLTAGSVDMAATGTVDPIHAIDKGAPISLFRIEAGPAPYQVYAKPGIHTFADLKGKTVMLDSAKGITKLYFDRMASPKELPPGSYQLVYTGFTSARFAALVAGSVDATILNTPYNFKAQAAHFSRLAAPADYGKGIPFNTYSVNIAWAKAHKPLIVKFLAAYAKGVDWFYNPANRQEAIDIMAKKSKSSRQDIADAYDYYIKLKEFDRTDAITKESVGTLIDVMKAQGDISGSTDLARFYDADLFGGEK